MQRNFTYPKNNLRAALNGQFSVVLGTGRCEGWSTLCGQEAEWFCVCQPPGLRPLCIDEHVLSRTGRLFFLIQEGRGAGGGKRSVQNTFVAFVSYRVGDRSVDTASAQHQGACGSNPTQGWSQPKKTDMKNLEVNLDDNWEQRPVTVGKTIPSCFVVEKSIRHQAQGSDPTKSAGPQCSRSGRISGHESAYPA